jgi:U4/U6.U5 tri-snRNP-associated protein 1
LGLKPLDLEKSAHEKAAESNFQTHSAQLKQQRDTLEIQKRLEKSKNRQKLRTKLVGKTLGEANANEPEDDPKKWILRQKRLAAQFQSEVDGLDSLAVQKGKSKEYTSRDLAGLSVDHELEDLNEGDELILTLKDKSVLDGILRLPYHNAFGHYGSLFHSLKCYFNRK